MVAVLRRNVRLEPLGATLLLRRLVEQPLLVAAYEARVQEEVIPRLRLFTQRGELVQDDTEDDVEQEHEDGDEEHEVEEQPQRPLLHSKNDVPALYGWYPSSPET